ncbi:MAG: HAD-IIIC family phosphatase, partial [Pseudobdellovibrionaceae bacterium]
QEALSFHLSLIGIDSDIITCDFSTLQQQAFDPNSELRQFQPDIVWNFSTVYDLSHLPARAEDSSAAENQIQKLKDLWQTLHSTSNLQVLQNSFDLPAERTFGHFEGGMSFSKTQTVQLINSTLREQRHPGVALFDLDWVSSLYGKQSWFCKRHWYQAKYPFSVDATSLVAYHGARTIAAMLGRSQKCLVLDLDNTLWGGTLGDDGLAGLQIGPDTAVGKAFLDFQYYLMGLKNRGILLAVCSKNEEALAREVFLSHPEMILKLEDFAAFQVNWRNKAENLNEIASQLELSPEALVFVDDSPFERNLVRRLAPKVMVPEMPDDIAEYIHTLDSLRYFETIDFSDEDARRHQLYSENRMRQSLRAETLDMAEYLKSLDMQCEVSGINSINSRRVTQLVNKSNQFNMTGQKVSQIVIDDLIENPQHMGRVYRLRDRFGDNGLISAAILRLDADTMTIENWVMSCRVLLRGVEEFVHRDLIRLAKSKGIRRVVGLYVKGERNALVAPLYRKLGFRLVSEASNPEKWELDVDLAVADARSTFIKDFTPAI